MTDMAPKRILGQIGDNNPPEDADPVRDRLTETYAKLADEAADLELEALGLPATVDTDEDAQKVIDVTARMKALIGRAEKSRVDEKEPFLRSGRSVDGFFKALGGPVEARVTRLQAQLNAFSRAKAERERAERRAEEERQRQEADRQRQEAEAASRAAREAEDQARAEAARVRSAADATERAEAEARMREAEQRAIAERAAAEQASADAVKTERIADTHGKAAAGAIGALSKTTAAGGSTSTSTFWAHRVADEAKLLESLGPLGPYLAADAISSAIATAKRKAVNSGAIEGLSIPGVEFFEDTKTAVRVAKPPK